MSTTTTIKPKFGTLAVHGKFAKSVAVVLVYRYGFNTQENSPEIYGVGNSTTAMFWEYDARLGRRWNLDPKPQIFISDYACFANNPILLTDHLGDKVGYEKSAYGSKFNTFLKVQSARLFNRNFNRSFKEMKRHRDDTFIFRQACPNDNNAQNSPALAVAAGANIWDNNNRSMNSINGWGDNNGINDQIYVYFKKQNRESKTMVGVQQDTPLIGTTKSKSYHSKHYYRQGTITLSGVSNIDTQADRVVVRSGNTVIQIVTLPVIQGMPNWAIVINFNTQMQGRISITIENQNQQNNSPGAFYLRFSIQSL